jgi:threonine dehydratase
LKKNKTGQIKIKMAMAMSSFVTLSDIEAATSYIGKSGLVRRTPLLHNFDVPNLVKNPKKQNKTALPPSPSPQTLSLHLKLESLQHTGSFKIRGMTNCFRVHEDAIRKHGAVTLSAGNAGRSFAFLCGRLNVKSTVCMPNTVPKDRVETIEGLGSTVELVPGVELMAAVDRYTREGRILIHPFDDKDLIAGHGSIGLELLEDMPDLGKGDVVAVCCGGGGLVSGVAAALKLKGCQARVVAVEPEGSPCMTASLALGRAANEGKGDFHTETIAHGLAPPFAGDITFQHVQKFVDEVILVSDAELVAATRVMYEHGFVCETSGCAGVAAAMAGKLVSKKGEEGVSCQGRIVCVVSGSNISTYDLYHETIVDLESTDIDTVKGGVVGGGVREESRTTEGGRWMLMSALAMLVGVGAGWSLRSRYH